VKNEIAGFPQVAALGADGIFAANQTVATFGERNFGGIEDCFGGGIRGGFL